MSINKFEPLRGALLNQLRNVLQNLTSNNERAEQIVQILITDHLDLGCAVIENVASEKAVELIDAEIGPSFASMRKPRDLAGSTNYVAGTYAQGPFARVPEALRPKPGHLSTAQLRVYDDFIKNIWQNQPSQNLNVLSAGPSVAPGLNAVPQQLDLVPEDSNRGSSHVPSVSSTHCGANDGVMQPNAEISSVTATFPAISYAELHVVEESGAVVPLSPSIHGIDRLSNVISESLLSTGDALEKYQQVAQKVHGGVKFGFVHATDYNNDQCSSMQ